MHDDSLVTLLRALQSASDEQEIHRLLASAATVLSLLSNPLNVALLTTELLASTSVWQRPGNLRTTLRVFGVFNTAAIISSQSGIVEPKGNPFKRQSALSPDEWATAVIEGADERSPRWRHLCLFVGLLTGFESKSSSGLSGSLLQRLGRAVVTAANLALEESQAQDENTVNSIVVLLSHVFDYLPDHERYRLNEDLLLPALIHAPFISREGFHSGYFLSIIDADVIQSGPRVFEWPQQSSTFRQFQELSTNPLMSVLGPLSRLLVFVIAKVKNADLITATATNLVTFTRTLCVQWQQNKLSEIDPTEEQTFLGDETLQITLPLLWRTLRSVLFAVLVASRSMMGRIVGSRSLPLYAAPSMAIQALSILRNLYFISSRLGMNNSSHYTFVNLMAIDVLSQYPVQAEAFLREIGPTSQSTIPQHPLDRCHDLFFLNTAEHFAIVLSPQCNEELLITAAAPYLGIESEPRLVETFEAAHCVMLAALAAPQNEDLLARHIHPYTKVVFSVFPSILSPTQFRMAVKTLVAITSPPAPIAQSIPLLPSTILEMVRYRMEGASSAPLPLKSDQPQPTETSDPSTIRDQVVMSEVSVLALALIDSLALLPLDQLEDWLYLVAESLSYVQIPPQLDVCKERFWQVLSSGEMDIARASLCLSWWGTRGGREIVMDKKSIDREGALMSGAISENGRL